jgi:hypothetical protein
MEMSLGRDMLTHPRKHSDAVQIAVDLPKEETKVEKPKPLSGLLRGVKE